jgi:hypothetical protein
MKRIITVVLFIMSTPTVMMLLAPDHKQRHGKLYQKQLQ